MALDKISDIILIVFVSISIPVYLIFIASVLLNRSKEPFNSAFFTLVLSLSVADIVNEFHTYLFIKTAGWGWFKEFWLTYGSRGSFLALYSNAMIFAMTGSQYLGVLLLAINRFTAIIHSTKHALIWSNQNLHVVIALQWTIPFILVLPMSMSQFQYTFYVHDGIVNNDSISVNFCDNNYMTVYFIVSTLLQTTTNVSTCSLYVAVFVSALKQSNKIAHSTTIAKNLVSNRATPTTPYASWTWRRRTIETVASLVDNMRSSSTLHQRELRFAFSGFLLFVVMLANNVYLILIVITGNPNFDDGLMYNIVCDVLSCINPYTLLIMSKQTRSAFLRTLKLG